MSKLSIIVPVYFNALNLHTTIPTLQGVLDALKPTMDGELVLVDDGSQDGSYAIIQEYTQKDPRVKGIRLSRNFGAYMAILAGLDNATGDCCAVIMADLQDPPELLLEMTARWRNGTKIVIATRSDREDRWQDRIFAQAFWSLMKRFAVPNLPEGGFDFILFDRCVADVIRSSREKNSHFMIQVFSTGFSQEAIPYTRKLRKAGKSKWTFGKKMKLVIDSFIAFSYLPIRMMSILGGIVAFIGFISAITIIVQKLVAGISIQGWPSLMVAILVLGGIQMMMLGIIGEYVWRAFDETRKRPNYIVAEKTHN